MSPFHFANIQGKQEEVEDKEQSINQMEEPQSAQSGQSGEICLCVDGDLFRCL